MKQLKTIENNFSSPRKKVKSFAKGWPKEEWKERERRNRYPKRSSIRTQVAQRRPGQGCCAPFAPLFFTRPVFNGPGLISAWVTRHFSKGASSPRSNMCVGVRVDGVCLPPPQHTGSHASHKGLRMRCIRSPAISPIVFG